MIIEIDFNSDEALYLQLRNQIIMGIATAQFHEGDSLPSVRQLADSIGINMHTVNKAYTVLKQEGYVPQRWYNRDEKLRRAMDALRTGFRDGVCYVTVRSFVTVFSI